MSNYTDETFTSVKITYRGEDPGAIGPGKIWVDASQEPPVVSVRNRANNGWDVVGGGGSGNGNVELLQIPIAFDTPNLVTTGAGAGGIEVFTPSMGDIIGSVPGLTVIDISTAFAGADFIFGHFYFQADGSYLTFAPPIFSNGTDLTVVDGTADLGGHWAISSNGTAGVEGETLAIAVDDTSPLMFVVDDDNGGAVDLTDGQGDIYIPIIRASSFG